MTVTPLMVDLSEQQVIIVGGGRIAERRVYSLLQSGAFLTVVSPKINDGLRGLLEKGQINWLKKHVEAKDFQDAFLIVVATDDPVVNQGLVKSAPSYSLISSAADATLGNVHFPAHFQRGKLSIGISTNGASPMLSASIKKELQGMYDEKYEDYLDFLYECRQLIKGSLLSKGKQKMLLKELMSETFLDHDKQRRTMTWLKKLFAKGGCHEKT